MSTFVSHTSPVTGKIEWIVQDDNYDFHQEVARSAYADMLHDTERNVMYAEALKRAILTMHERGNRALVLDIGTGTGLLSMMAAKYGADSIIACEAFKPMADCARQVIKDNGYEKMITVIPKRSTELIVGHDGDMPVRANILVTEVFDTELIGEGGLGTFRHALQQLLETDCIVVPSSAVVYAQVVRSAHFRLWNQFAPVKVSALKSNRISVTWDNDEVGGDKARSNIYPPTEVRDCLGSPAVHDLQLDQVSQSLFEPLTPPTRVLSFDFSGKIPLQLNGDSHIEVKSLTTGSCDAVFMWWVLQMDTKGEVELSTAPRWVHPTPEDMQWRDHWMQAVYYPLTRTTVTEGQTISLRTYHDEYSLWFDVSHIESCDMRTNGLRTSDDNDHLNILPNGEGVQDCTNYSLSLHPPVCTCGAHIACSRTRIAMLNDSNRNSCYVEALSKVVTDATVCICLGDESLLSLIVAKLGAKKVYSIQPNSLSARLIESYVKNNDLEDRVCVLRKTVDELTAEDLEQNKITLLAAEPFFSASFLPWHNIYYLYARTHLKDFLAESCSILPATSVIKAVAVEFKDLHKIRKDVGCCEGFNLKAFDKLIQAASNIADGYIEPHPLWEYPSRPMSDVVNLLSINFTIPLHEEVKTVQREGSIELNSDGCCNGIALWMDYKLDAFTTISTGLLSPPVKSEDLKWDPYTRQAVHLFTRETLVKQPNGSRLKYNVTFQPKSGDINFEFDFVDAV